MQRIENLDKAVEHLMRRVEALDSRVNDNIDKTDAVITKLRTLDLKLFNSYPPIMSAEAFHAARITENRSGSHAEDSKYTRVVSFAKTSAGSYRCVRNVSGGKSRRERDSLATNSRALEISPVGFNRSCLSAADVT